MKTKITTTLGGWWAVLAIAAALCAAGPAAAADDEASRNATDKIKSGLKTVKDVKQKYDNVKEKAEALASVAEFLNEIRLATAKGASEAESSKHWGKARQMMLDWAIDQAKSKAIDLILAANPELAAAVAAYNFVKNGAEVLVTIAQTGQKIGQAISPAKKSKTGLVNQLLKD